MLDRRRSATVEREWKCTCTFELAFNLVELFLLIGVRTSGTIIAAPQTYQYFERLQERIVRFVTKNSRIGRDEFLRLMMDTQDLASDVGSVLYGEEAVACGLIQRLGSLSDALDALYALIDEKKK